MEGEMKKAFIAAALVSLSSGVLASGPVIRETDTEIIVEFSGTADEKPAAAVPPPADDNAAEEASAPAEEAEVSTSPGTGEDGAAPAPRRDRRGRRGARGGSSEGGVGE